MKSFEIIIEEAKKEGIELAEAAIVKAFGILEAAAPRLAIESEDSIGKLAGTVLMVALPPFKLVVEKFADLNKDGKIG